MFKSLHPLVNHHSACTKKKENISPLNMALKVGSCFLVHICNDSTNINIYPSRKTKLCCRVQRERERMDADSKSAKGSLIFDYFPLRHLCYLTAFYFIRVCMNKKYWMPMCKKMLNLEFIGKHFTPSMQRND